MLFSPLLQLTLKSQARLDFAEWPIPSGFMPRISWAGLAFATVQTDGSEDVITPEAGPVVE